MRKRSSLLAIALGFAGCSGEPSHIPPLWQLPGAAISSAVGNAAYDARRSGVKRLVTRHEHTLVAEIANGGGPKLKEAMDVARIRAANRLQVVGELKGRPDIYRAGPGLDIEAVTVALMVHGG